MKTIYAKHLYYDKENLAVSERYPHFYPKDEETFIYVDEAVFNKTLSCPYGKIWIVKDGKPVLADDEEVQNSDEYKKYVKDNKICEYQAYLDSTDYVIAKLNELKLEDDGEFEKAKAEYKEVLAKRKEARNKINELEGNSERSNK